MIIHVVCGWDGLAGWQFCMLFELLWLGLVDDFRTKTTQFVIYEDVYL